MNKGIIVHHWDADGIASAALLLKHKHPDYRNWTPDRGIRRLDEDHIKWLADFPHIVIADMAIPLDNIRALSDTTKVTIFDHHIQRKPANTEFINPVASGGNPDTYPCTTWVLKEKLGLPVSTLVVLGLIGDMQEKAKNMQLWDEVQEFIEMTGTSFDELNHMTQVLDSLYKLGDINEVMKAPKRIMNDPSSIISNKKWLQSFESVEKAFNEIVSRPHFEKNGFVLVDIDTQMNLVSSIAKRISWSSARNEN